MHLEIPFKGHKNIRALHKKTIEITKESELTPSGDCIIGVNAFYGCKEIPNKIKKRLRDPNANILFSIAVDDLSFQVKGKGHQDLVCTHPTDIVLRKSNYICPRTLAIKCDKASDSIPRKLIRLLQNPKTTGIITIKIT